MWVSLQALCNSSTYILLNNEDNIFAEQEHMLVPGIRPFILPYTVSDMEKLGLPIVPRKPKWKNSWHNGDYGYYLANLLFGAGCDISRQLGEENIFVVQIDNDIGLAGCSWSDLILNLPINDYDAISLGYTREPEKNWPHLIGAEKYYEKPSAMLFGFQGFRMSYLKDIYDSRLEQAQKLKHICNQKNIDYLDLSEDDAYQYWPICEAFIASEFSKRKLRVMDIMKNVNSFWRHFNVSTSSWIEPIGPSSLANGQVFLYHPLKEPCYGLYINPS
jgi:hypothetical protein